MWNMRDASRFAGPLLLLVASGLGCGATDNLIGAVGAHLPGGGSGGTGQAMAGDAGEGGDFAAVAGLAGTTSNVAGGPSATRDDAPSFESVDDAAGASGAGDLGSAGGAPIAIDDCVIRVSPLGNDNNPGKSFELAFRTVQHALGVANVLIERAACSSVELWVAAGTNTPTTGTDRSATFQLIPNVALFGGFAGTESARAQRNVSAHVTTLSGEIGASDQADNSYHVVTGADGATLDGFTVSGGYTNEFPYSGAGMYNVSASPTVTNCTFANNVANRGVGMYNESASPTVTGCTFTGNTAMFGYGAGMYNSTSSPTVTDCVFADNDAQYSGAGMYNDTSSPTIANSTFSGNSGLDGGGGITNYHSSPIITHCRFVSNSGYAGGALDNAESSPTVESSTFDGNRSYLGGATYNGASSPRFSNCVFTRNSVSGTAKFTGENGASGGALYNDASSPVLTNCTFTNNSASISGGAMHSENSSAPVVTNSIFWGDLQGDGTGEIVDTDSSTTTTVRHSIVQGGASGSATISADPLFVDAIGGDLHLVAGSPAIDAGDSCANGVALSDLDGQARWDISSAPNAAGGVDIGAFEFQGTAEFDSELGALTCP